jgi:hypothetical protein
MHGASREDIAQTARQRDHVAGYCGRSQALPEEVSASCASQSVSATDRKRRRQARMFSCPPAPDLPAYPALTSPLTSNVACLPETAQQTCCATLLLTAEHGTGEVEEKCGGPRRILDHG